MTSTLTITDDKLSALLSEMEKSFTGCQGHGYTGAAEEYADMISALRELQERRKAAMDSEPVGYFGRFDPDDEDLIDQCSKNVKGAFPLYRQAQPAPVVTFYRDGIEAAANYLDKQRESFDNEHGQFDPDTNSFEFGILAAQEHSDTLAELAEGIRALHPNAGNSPVIPDGYVMVPKDVSPEQLRAFQLKTKIGAYVTANWSDAYDSLRELWNEVIAHYFKNQDDGLKK
ncbi:TPA: hypothetical protein ACQDK2_005945 [Raoultella planticola]